MESSKRLTVQSLILACVGLALVVLFVVFGSIFKNKVALNALTKGTRKIKDFVGKEQTSITA